MAKITVKGDIEVQRNINNFFAGDIKRLERAVVTWARRTRNESVKMAPSDTGNMRRTSFFDHSRDGKSIYARVGYTAKYAPAMHEILNPSSGIPRTTGSKKGTYWEVGQPKFLEIPARRNLKMLNRLLKG